MRKITALVVIACLALAIGNRANAQIKSRLGITGGVNYNEVHFKQQDIFAVDRGVGGDLGVMGELEIPGIGFAVDGSIMYDLRTGKLHLGDRKVWATQGFGDENLQLHYVYVPLNLKFKYHKLNGLEDKIMPLVYVGPGFKFLAAKTGGAADAVKGPPVSVDLHMGFGCELFRRVQVHCNYSFSLGRSIRTKVLDENDAKNRAWTLSVTYFLK